MSLTAEQIERRKRGVGCSEILAALGKDPRCSRVELYLRKLGELPDPDFSDDPRVHFGTVLEPIIRKEFARRVGRRVIVPRRTLEHPDVPLVGHADGWINKREGGFEAKTCDKFEAAEFGEEDTDQVPLRYVVQCAGYMAIKDTGKWQLAVLIGGNDFRIYEIPRDPELEAAILAGVREFWSHVEQREPPEPSTPEDVKLLWPKSLRPTRLATPEIEETCFEHAKLKVLLKQATEKEAELAAEIKRFLGDAGDLVTDQGKTLATWRSNRPKRVLDRTRLALEQPQLFTDYSDAFNEQRFAAEQPELYEQFCEDVPGNRPFLNKLIKEVSP